MVKEQDKGNAKRLENQEKAAYPAPASKTEHSTAHRYCRKRLNPYGKK